MKTSQLVALFTSLKYMILLVVVFLFPLFFLPITQEYFATNKFFLIGYAVIILAAISVIELLVTRRLVWMRRVFDSSVLLFILSIGLSTLLVTPNKVQSLLNPHVGLISMVSLGALYYYLSRSTQTGTEKGKVEVLFGLLSISSLIVSLLTILFFFNPFKLVALPVTLQFLKAPGFTTLGNPLDLAIFLGFFVALEVGQIVTKKHFANPQREMQNILPSLVLLVTGAVAFLLTVYTILKTGNDPQTAVVVFPPFSVSWYAAVENLKNPMSALFGVGVDNFSAAFAHAKDLAYNTSPLWQIQSFNVSRSTLLHVFTEAGLFGLVAFVLLLLSMLREMNARGRMHNMLLGYVLPVGYLLAVVLLVPPSIVTFFLIFVMLVVLSYGSPEQEPTNVNLSHLIPVYLGMVVFGVLVVGAAGYFLSQAYLGEYFFKVALDGIANNNIAQLYNNEREAIVRNPYIERYRINFSQTNLLIANNIASKAAPQQGSTSGQSKQLSDQDRSQIGQAIEASISEAKAAVSLNPQKSFNWENLANIYRNIINVAQGADVWTISSYQRAIVLDPQNAMYRLNLGGVYFSLQNFEEASKMFEQGASLKPDWSNAHYNLAWSLYEKGDYQRAVQEMQTVLTLIDPKKDEADFKRASSELDTFKAKLPKEQSATQSATPQQLNLATPQSATVEPKLKLPTNVSPEK